MRVIISTSPLSNSNTPLYNDLLRENASNCVKMQGEFWSEFGTNSEKTNVFYVGRVKWKGGNCEYVLCLCGLFGGMNMKFVRDLGGRLR